MVTAKQLSFRFNVSTRLIQAKAKEIGITKTKGRYLFDKEDVKNMAKALQNEKTKQNANVRKEDILMHLKTIKEQLAELEYLIKQI